MRIFKKTKKMIELEKLVGKDIKKFLLEMYRDKDMTMPDIVAYLKTNFDFPINPGTISYWFLKMDIETRTFKF